MRHADGYAYRVSLSNGYSYRDTFGHAHLHAGRRRTDNNTLRLE
jgi:hypothetical protein